MSKTRKIFIVLALIALTALGGSLIRGWPPSAIAAGQAQSLENDTLFFVSGPQPSIQRVAASEPRQLAEQAASAATESIPIDTAMCATSPACTPRPTVTGWPWRQVVRRVSIRL